MAHAVEAALEGIVAADDVDLDAEEIDGKRALAEAGEADGILFRGNDGAGPAGLAALEHAGDLVLAETVMIGVAAGIDQLNTELTETFLEALGAGDAGDGADTEILEERERHDLVGKDLLEMERLVGALDELGVLVVAAEFLAQFGEVAAIALGDEDDVGAAELLGRLAQEAAREEVAVGEGGLAVDEDDVDALLEAEELEAVVEEKGVAVVFANGVEAAFDAVLVDEDEDVLEVGGEHEGLVAGEFGIEKEGAAIGNDAGRMAVLDGAKAVEETLRKRDGLAFVAAAEDGDLAAPLGQFAGEELHHRRLAGAADGEVADADDEAAEGVDGTEAAFEPPEAPFDAQAVEAGKHPEEKTEHPGSKAPASFEDDIDGELLEPVKTVGSHGRRLAEE